MSDRRPENRQRVFIRKHAEHGYAYVEEAEPRENPDDFSGWYVPESDLVAVVRRGVESGTIEGAEFECERCDGEGTDGFDRNGSHAAGEYREFTCSQCGGSGRVLVIPVDGEKT